MALGFAGTQAAGLNTFFTSGDFTKSLHPGKAAFNGVLSARLAALGATSPPTMLEHEKGYVQAFSLEPKVAALTEGLGTHLGDPAERLQVLPLDPGEPRRHPGDARRRRPRTT